jgi:hypothetical protein
MLSGHRPQTELTAGTRKGKAEGKAPRSGAGLSKRGCHAETLPTALEFCGRTVAQFGSPKGNAPLRPGGAEALN